MDRWKSFDLFNNKSVEMSVGYDEVYVFHRLVITGFVVCLRLVLVWGTALASEISVLCCICCLGFKIERFLLENELSVHRRRHEELVKYDAGSSLRARSQLKATTFR